MDKQDIIFRLGQYNIGFDTWVREPDYEKVDKWLYKVLSARQEILERIVTIFDLQKKYNIGDPKVLQSLYETEKILKKKTSQLRLEMPIQHKQLKAFLANSLEDLLADLENIINQFKVFGEYPDITAWYPNYNTDKNSNSDKLSSASDWMDPLMEKIGNIKLPTHEDVLNIFKDEFPGFELEFDLRSMDSKLAKGGKPIKISIATALKFIFEGKYPSKTITTKAIISHYNKKNTW